MTGRHFSLSNTLGSIRPTARHELNVLSVYPNDDASRDQALALVQMEYERWTTSEREDFQHSDLVVRIAESHKKKTGKRITAGLIALAQVCLHNAGFRASPNLAMNVVSEFAAEADKVKLLFAYGKDPTNEFEATISYDLADQRMAWSEYRSISHILAAGLIADEYLWFEPGFAPTPEADAVFFNTLMALQSTFLSLPKVGEWNTWVISASPDFNPSDFPVLDARRVCNALFDPWLNSEHGKKTMQNKQLFKGHPRKWELGV